MRPISPRKVILNRTVRKDVALLQTDVFYCNSLIEMTLIMFVSTGELCRSKKVFFHTDAAQAIGKVKVNVEEHKVDLLSISGHKIYGPKGEAEIVMLGRFI